MATIVTTSLREFNVREALEGATLAFSADGTTEGKVTGYVNYFKASGKSDFSYLYEAKQGSVTYYFDTNGLCADNDYKHTLFIVDTTITPTKGTVSSRGDAEAGEGGVDINTLQPREHFAIAALKGILSKMENPLTLTGAQILQICNKSFEIANGMMVVAAETRAAVEEGGGGTSPGIKDEVEVSPEELTQNSEKILYNMYVQNHNNAVLEKQRFDKLTGASYDGDNLSSVKGLKLQTDANNPLIAKLHADSEIKKVAEVTKVSEVTKITNKVTVGVDGTANVNLASTDITMPVSGEVECSNMLTEPVYVSVRNNELDVHVTNMPSVPTEPVQVFGTVSVDNFPTSGGTTEPDNDQNG